MGARVVVGAALLAVVLGGCSSGSSDAPEAAPASPASAAPAPTPSAAPTCVIGARATTRWPAPLPSDLPVPPGTSGVSTPRSSGDGVTVVQFTTSGSLRDGVTFLLQAMEPAGYTLGRGDAEATEADAPFAKGPLRGVFRMLVREPCRTAWLLATARARTGGSPLLPVRPGVSPSPLPFG